MSDKRQTTEWKNKIAEDTSDKGYYPKHTKNTYKSILKQT